MAWTAITEKHFSKLILAIWLITSLLMLAVLRTQISGWVMGDPDDQLRMVQVRDWLAGQSWFDVSQHRMNLPDGGPMHWSRIVDLPLALSMLVLRPFLGIEGAELATAVLVPMLTYGATLFLVAHISRKLFGTGAALLATATLWTSFLVMQQLAPMRIDHHGWQIVLFLTCVSAMLVGGRSLFPAIVIGAALALWLNISIEGLPFAVVFIVGLGLRWVWPISGEVKNAGRIVATACLSFAASSMALFVATQGVSATATYCDTVSPPHLWAFVAASALIAIGVLVTERSASISNPLARACIGLLAGFGGASVIYLSAPQCMSDAFADLDPVVRQYWFNRGLEGLPLWAQLPESIHMATGGIAAGLLAAAYWIRQKDDMPLRAKFEYLVLLIASLLIGALVFRTIVYALCLSVILATAIAINLYKRAEAGSGLGSRMGWRIAATLLLLPATFASSIGNGLSASTASAETVKSKVQTEDFYDQIRKCQRPKTIMQLRALPSAQLMAPLDSSPAILQFTSHKVVATGHHRNQDAMRDVINAFILPPGQARAIFARRKIDYLAACAASFELMIYENDAPNGLWAQIKKGNVPVWLKPAQNIGGNLVWKVDPLALAGQSQ